MYVLFSPSPYLQPVFRRIRLLPCGAAFFPWAGQLSSSPPAGWFRKEGTEGGGRFTAKNTVRNVDPIPMMIDSSVDVHFCVCEICQSSEQNLHAISTRKMALTVLYMIIFKVMCGFLKNYFIVVQLQLSAFSLHHSPPPQPKPPPSLVPPSPLVLSMCPL